MAEPEDDHALRAKLDALRGALDRRGAEKRAGEARVPSESERAATASAISMACARRANSRRRSSSAA